MAVCSRDGARADLDALLSAVLPQLRRGDTVRVVDSASRGRTVAEAARAHGVPCDRLDRPGVSRARNHALAVATTTAVAFVDDDCLPAPGWVDGLRTGLAEGADAVFGRIDPVAGDGVPVSVLVATEPYELDLQTLDRAGGAGNLAVRRQAALDRGGFDPLLGTGAPFPGAEDKDLMARMVAAGGAVRYRPGAVVRHRSKPTRWSALRSVNGYGAGSAALAHKLRGMGLVAQAPARAAARRACTSAVDGYWFGVALETAFVAGVASGAWRSRPLVVVEGRLARGRR